MWYPRQNSIGFAVNVCYTRLLSLIAAVHACCNFSILARIPWFRFYDKNDCHGILQEAKQEALQILGFAASKIKQADQHSQSAVCASQVLLVTQNVCSPQDLADVMPDLLRLQPNKQVTAAVAYAVATA